MDHTDTKQFKLTPENDRKTKRNEMFRRLDQAISSKDVSQIKNIQTEMSKLGITGSLKSANKVKKDKK